MRKRLVAWLALASATAVAGSLFAASCGKKLNDEPLQGAIVADWFEGSASTFFATDGYGNGSVFNTWWNKDNVVYKDGTMQLTMSDMPEDLQLTLEDYTQEELDALAAEGKDPTQYKYYAGELRSYYNYGYGDYEVSMKPAKKSGTASTFFLYTGPGDRAPGASEDNPWDEIDIEFLGSDTTKVQFNYYVDGVGGHEYMYDLGFDASEDFHEYGFRWTAEYIVWFVDDKPVYKVEASEENPLPSSPSKILMNYWSGTQKAEGWMGQYSDPQASEGPQYRWVRASADPSYGEIPGSKPVLPIGEKVDLAFSTDTGSGYTIDPENVATDSVNVTYDTLGWPYCVIRSDISAIAAENDTFSVKIKNNDTDDLTIRFDIQGSKSVASGEASTDCCNVSATVDGGSGLATDLAWGGTKLTVGAGEEVTLVITYEPNGAHGTPKNLLVYMDSLSDPVDATASGNVTLSDFMFGDNPAIDNGTPGGNEGGEQGGDDTPQTPSAPPAGNEYAIDLSTATVGPWGYEYSVDGDALNITYTDLQGGNYNNVNVSGFATNMKANNKFIATVTNNGDALVNLRIDIMTTEQVTAHTQACNLSATQDGVTVTTDMVYGGSFFTIPVGETISVEIVYDYEKAVNSVQFLIDSYKDTNIYSGNITVSGMKLVSTLTDLGEEGGEGTTPPAGEGSGEQGGTGDVADGNVNLTFTSDVYTVSNSGTASDSVDVTYNNVEGATYANIASSDAASYANGNDTFTLVITNNATADSGETVLVRIDIIGTTEYTTSANFTTKVCNASSTTEFVEGYTEGADWGYTDTAYGGTSIRINPGVTVKLSIKYDVNLAGPITAVQICFDSSNESERGQGKYHSGNVTISDFTFTNTAATAE